jgi:hypothetical protein
VEGAFPTTGRGESAASRRRRQFRPHLPAFARIIVAEQATLTISSRLDFWFAGAGFFGKLADNI